MLKDAHMIIWLQVSRVRSWVTELEEMMTCNSKDVVG